MKKVKITGDILLVMGLILLTVSTFLFDFKIPIIGIAGIIIACIGYLYFLIFWRCPFCHKHLPFNGMIGMVSCPYCGNELDS